MVQGIGKDRVTEKRSNLFYFFAHILANLFILGVDFVDILCDVILLMARFVALTGTLADYRMHPISSEREKLVNFVSLLRFSPPSGIMRKIRNQSLIFYRYM